jgi:hypothetical protein|tara:strand:+ start:1195 stop:1683 length:489 start_codon:yes stop_codon:yes gene_type:complete
MPFHTKSATTSIGLHRELRRVPACWVHPKDKSGQLIPLFQDLQLKQSQDKWDRHNKLWSDGFYEDITGRPVPLTDIQREHGYSEWVGERPREEGYMPTWDEGERTHYQLYETTTEGTPISPVMRSLKELAEWLGKKKVNAYANLPLTEADWFTALKEMEAYQ